MISYDAYLHFPPLCFVLQEEKKILFYHPCEVEKNEKIRNVGLCEAIVQFTKYASVIKQKVSVCLCICECVCMCVKSTC